VFNLDKLNFNNDPQTGDGFRFFMQGATIDSQMVVIYLQPRAIWRICFQSFQILVLLKIIMIIVIMKIKRNMSSGTCIATHNQGIAGQ
jgi:hypothetical protein